MPNTEQKSGVNSEILRAEFGLAQPILLVAAEQQEVAEGSSTWDVFMWHYFGHPISEDYKPIRHPKLPDDETIFPYRSVKIVTPNTAVLIRSTVPNPFRPEDCFAVTAHFDERKLRTWFVSDIELSNDGARSRSFILSESGSEHTTLPGAEPSSSWLAVASLKSVQGRAKKYANAPRVVLGTNRCGFQKPGQELELFVGDVASLYRGLAKQKEGKAATIAA
jgi:hypothetical protein